MRPEDLGLASLGRRRAPGLRREELSQAAGVGLTWLTWLEQGRDINASTEALLALSRTLRLSDDEHTYLFTLAGEHVPKRSVHPDELPSRVHALVDHIAFPACVINYRLEVPYLNEMGARFFLYDRGEDRNVARRVFLDDRYRGLFGDVSALETLAVGILRLGWSRHPQDAVLEALIAELSQRSLRFAQLWEERHVMHPVEQVIVGFRHPDFGDAPYEAQTLLLNENADVSIYIAMPLEPGMLNGLDRT
jgi:transcriptional regulator with XRE-family HTH domain